MNAPCVCDDIATRRMRGCACTSNRAHAIYGTRNVNSNNNYVAHANYHTRTCARDSSNNNNNNNINIVRANQLPHVHLRTRARGTRSHMDESDPTRSQTNLETRTLGQ